jgi:hypothetical protein
MSLDGLVRGNAPIIVVPNERRTSSDPVERMIVTRIALAMIVKARLQRLRSKMKLPSTTILARPFDRVFLRSSRL